MNDRFFSIILSAFLLGVCFSAEAQKTGKIYRIGESEIRSLSYSCLPPVASSLHEAMRNERLTAKTSVEV